MTFKGFGNRIFDEMARSEQKGNEGSLSYRKEDERKGSKGTKSS